MTRRGVSRRIDRRNYALAVADVVPFHGLRFDESKAGPLSELISPPYDVISDAQRDALYARSPFNVVRLEEGKEEPTDGASNNKYTRARTALDEWLGKGILDRKSVVEGKSVSRGWRGRRGEKSERM